MSVSEHCEKNVKQWLRFVSINEYLLCFSALLKKKVNIGICHLQNP